MKETMRNLIFVAFAVVGGMVMLVDNAQGVDAAMPSEVKALIGLKLTPVRVEGKDIKREPWAPPLPPDYVLMTPASIPNFVSKNSGWGSISFDEGIVGGRWPVFIAERIDTDKSLEILDVQMLPSNLIDWRYVEGEFKNQSEHWKFIKDRYTFSERCRTGEEDERVIFGLVKQEKGKETCSHFSKRVKLAWLIDQQSGKISPLPTKGLQCFYLTMDDCF